MNIGSELKCMIAILQSKVLMGWCTDSNKSKCDIPLADQVWWYNDEYHSFAQLKDNNFTTHNLHFLYTRIIFNTFKQSVSKEKGRKRHNINNKKNDSDIYYDIAWAAIHLQ